MSQNLPHQSGTLYLSDLVEAVRQIGNSKCSNAGVLESLHKLFEKNDKKNFEKSSSVTEETLQKKLH